MPVVEAQEMLDSRTMVAEAKGFHRTYQRKFWVMTDSDLDDGNVALNYPLIPKLFDYYPGDFKARVSRLSVAHNASLGRKWRDDTTLEGRMLIVTVDYDSHFDFDPDKEIAAEENPLLKPAVWKFSAEKIEKAVRFDINDPPQAINNSAGVPIDPPLTIPWTLPIITIEKNLPDFQESWVSQYQDCVNDADWYGIPQWCAQLRSITSSEVWDKNFHYWPVTYTIAINWEGWRPDRVLDQGYSVLDDDGNLVTIRDRFGAPLPNASLLDGDGGKLPEGDDPVYLEYHTKREIDFTAVIV